MAIPQRSEAAPDLAERAEMQRTAQTETPA
jgi:hypothetical protein